MMSETIHSTVVWAIGLFNLPTQWRSRGGGKWVHAPRGALLGGASTHLIQPCKRGFKQKFRPKYA